MTTLHRIDDFARPRLPWPIWTLNRSLEPFKGRVHLDESNLLSTAVKLTGLTDFGDDHFREPLRVLLGALESEARLTLLGRLLLRQWLLQLLTTRLLVQDLVIRHPEILELPVPSPIVILGLPRTGTTHLHTRAILPSAGSPTGRASIQCLQPRGGPHQGGPTRGSNSASQPCACSPM